VCTVTDSVRLGLSITEISDSAFGLSCTNMKIHANGYFSISLILKI